MDLESEPEETVSRARPMYQACDSCRQRKIKCDELDPCSACTTSSRQCSRTHVVRPREKRQRILVSKEHEHKLERLEAQIQALTTLLQDVRRQSPQDSTIKTVTVAHTPTVQEAEARFEGDSSLTAHSRFANDFITHVLRQSGQQPHVLTALRELTSEPPTPQSEGRRRDPAPKPTAQYELPPFSAVAALLKAERERTDGSLLRWFTIMSTPNALMQHCMDVYFTSDYTESQFILATGNLFWLFADHAATTTDLSEREQHQKHEQMCKTALDVALSRLPLHMPLTEQSVEALVTGAVHAVGTARPLLAWTFVSKASEMAQSLGMHRAAAAQRNGQPSSQLPPFWVLYVMDKGLSLRLGRASTIQDFDVDLPRGLYGPYLNGAPHTHAQYIDIMIRISRLQGNIYTSLYSPEALLLSQDDRTARAYRLAAEMVAYQAEQFDIIRRLGQSTEHGEYDAWFLTAEEASSFCLLTLIYRVLPAEQGSAVFASSCLLAAREALKRHQRCMEMIRSDDLYMLEIYVNWSVLYTPFLPFIVVFCSAIERGDHSDLGRLKTFLDALEPARALSQPMDKAFRLFQALLDIAHQSAGVTDSKLDRSGIAHPRLATATLPLLPNDLQSTQAWSAEQQQLLSDWQDEALQLFSTDFIFDGSLP